MRRWEFISGAEVEDAYVRQTPLSDLVPSALTIADSFLTGLTLGPLLLAALGAKHGQSLLIAAAGAAVAHLLVETWRFLSFVGSEESERQATAQLLSGPLARLFLLRLGLLAVGAVVLPALGFVDGGFGLAVTGALLGRYLFF